MESYFKVKSDLVVGDVLKRYTREDLRALAKTAGVRRGRDKLDTVRNLLGSGTLCFSVRVYQDPPTTAQIRFLNRMGVTPGKSREECAAIISKMLP
jgi:hypothetical protein